MEGEREREGGTHGPQEAHTIARASTTGEQTPPHQVRDDGELAVRHGHRGLVALEQQATKRRPLNHAVRVPRRRPFHHLLDNDDVRDEVEKAAEAAHLVARGRKHALGTRGDKLNGVLPVVDDAHHRGGVNAIWERVRALDAQGLGGVEDGQGVGEEVVVEARVEGHQRCVVVQRGGRTRVVNNLCEFGGRAGGWSAQQVRGGSFVHASLVPNATVAALI